MIEHNFKKGDIVYDSINFPETKLIVGEVIQKHISCLILDFSDNNLGSGRISYSGKDIKLLSFTPYQLTNYTQERL